MDLSKIREDKEVAEREITVALKKFSLKHGKELGSISINLNWGSTEVEVFSHPFVDIEASIKI